MAPTNFDDGVEGVHLTCARSRPNLSKFSQRTMLVIVLGVSTSERISGDRYPSAATINRLKQSLGLKLKCLVNYKLSRREYLFSAGLPPLK